VGIGIQKTNAGIGIPASIISVRYRTKKCRTAVIYSGTVLASASLVFSSPVPDWSDAGWSGIPVVKIAEPHNADISASPAPDENRFGSSYKQKLMRPRPLRKRFHNHENFDFFEIISPFLSKYLRKSQEILTKSLNDKMFKYLKNCETAYYHDNTASWHFINTVLYIKIVFLKTLLTLTSRNCCR
jgi:hypothetical protein